ncbi:GCN5-like N-acetyltransferase [Pseudomonas sp. M47T1]|uniref:GNAT family N-acetyltransferase n=1 Tax=unclassified Pseudomonas TaxID=196821 RepID=UPI00026082EC|nr:GNAT family N-acetyltransferase [Pseudomonas sp. M47T1]EIK96496.1 GCN5-like N-acetyltransferase [Pseudomonas sp. M47T1]
MNAAQLRRVTVESFAHYRQGLVELLVDSVKQGASIGFLADLDAHDANSYFDEVKNRIAINDLVLWVVVRDEQVMASAQLVFCKRVNGLNRAEVQKLMVRSDAQRRGMGQQLMQAVEIAARQYHRGLLHLDTEAGSPAEAFYLSQGYKRAGQIPGFACRPDGEYTATAFFYKTL